MQGGKGKIEKSGGSLQTLIQQTEFKELTSGCARGSLYWILGKKFSWKGLSSIGTDCTGKQWSHYPWKCSKNLRIWHVGPWFNEHGGGAGLVVGLDVLKIFSDLNDSATL